MTQAQQLLTIPEVNDTDALIDFIEETKQLNQKLGPDEFVTIFCDSIVREYLSKDQQWFSMIMQSVMISNGNIHQTKEPRIILLRMGLHLGSLCDFQRHF